MTKKFRKYFIKEIKKTKWLRLFIVAILVGILVHILNLHIMWAGITGFILGLSGIFNN